MTVLVVDDNDFQRLAAVRLLEAAGVPAVLQAADGHEALDLLRTVGAPPELVLSDVDMPGMDGIEFLRNVAAEGLARAVAVSSSLDQSMLAAVESMARAYGLQVLGAIEKPLTPEGLAGLLAGFEPEARRPAVDGRSYGADALRAALRTGELRPWFQPKVDVASARPHGVEALIRWVRPDGSVLGPGAFLPSIEREGLVEELTEAVLRHACRSAAEWSSTGRPLGVSVNLSMTCLDEVQVTDRYVAIAAEHGLDPALLTFEVTETAVAGDLARCLDVLTRLRLRGFGLSIDDFGTGYSSLAQLRQMPCTELKVDQSFVSGAHVDPRRRAMVETSLDLAKRLGITTVAEGVELRAEWDLLASLGTDSVQGYFVAKPMPADEVPAWCDSWTGPRA